MQIRLPDSTALKAELAAIGRQAPFAVSLGVNNLGLAAQRAAQAEVKRAFSLRGTASFFEKGVVFKRGTKSSPTATLSIGVEGAWPGTATKRASAILARHEEGGRRESTERVKAGGQLVEAGFFLPGPGLRTPSTNVPRRLYPANLGATLRRNPSGEQYYAASTKQRGRGRMQARASYFVIPRVGIFERQRIGGFGSGLRPIWFFSRSVRTAPRTGFREAADDVIVTRFDDYLREAIGIALATAR